MGIDIYMRWKGQTEGEVYAQYTFFSRVHGHVGFIHEDYRGEPYATRTLVPEAFEDEAMRVGDDGMPVGAKVPAKVLRERLPETIRAAIERERTIYENPRAGVRSKAVKAFEDFVKLAEKKEREIGEPVTIRASW